jgi:acyl-CoA synthetase (AMP-forming)/AMP-acid ligase II
VTTLPGLVARAAAWYADRPAVTDAHVTLSFRDLHRRSNRLANALLGLSPEPGGRVAVLAANRAELVEIDFAISKAGKIRVPVNTRLTEAEIRYVVGDAGADVIVTDPPRRELATALAADPDGPRHVVVLPATGAGGDDGTAAGDGRPGGPHRYRDLLAAARDAAPAVPHPPDAGNFILYTSGTTGRPKGALATNRSRLAATMAMLTEELDVPLGGAMAHVGSMAHGSGSKVLAYLLRGARNIPVPRWDPEQFLDLVERERVTGTFLVPTMLSMLVEAAGGARRDLSSLRSVSYGGAPIAPARLEEAVARFGRALVQVYGSCEAPHPVFVLTGEQHLALSGRLRDVAPVGREALHSEVRLVAADGRDAGPGEPGEMWVRGPNVMAGYWRNPEATAAVLDGDGWYRTGDIAWRDDEHFYYIVDRSRDMIITGGLNVYPAEVENVIQQHPAVADVAVIGVPDPVWGESVKALVVRRPGARLTGEEVVAHCRRSLAGYKKPRFVEFVDGLPKGATGKTLKRELRAAHRPAPGRTG